MNAIGPGQGHQVARIPANVGLSYHASMTKAFWPRYVSLYSEKTRTATLETPNKRKKYYSHAFFYHIKSNSLTNKDTYSRVANNV